MSNVGRGALLSVGAALFAAAFLIPYKAAGALASRDAVVLVMLLCAAGFNTATALGRHRNALSLDRVTLVASLGLAGFTALGNIAVSRALVHLDPGMTSVLQQTQILFVAVMGWIFLRERITLRFMIGALIALGGFALMHVPGAISTPDEGRATGMMWAAFSAVCFGAMHVITRKVIHRIKPVWVNALRLWLAALIMACLPGSVADVLDMSATPWLYCAMAAFVGPFIARVCLMHAVRFITAAQSVLITLITPLFAFVFGFFAFGATPGLLDVAGGAIILAGVALPILEIARARPSPGLVPAPGADQRA